MMKLLCALSQKNFSTNAASPLSWQVSPKFLIYCSCVHRVYLLHSLLPAPDYRYSSKPIQRQTGFSKRRSNSASTMTKTILITGTSSGIGRATAEYFAEHGWNVVATMRKPTSVAGEALSKLENVCVIALDVTSQTAIAAAVQTTLDRFGKLDALVNNAGYGLAGPMEFATSEQLEAQYQTNLLGPIRLMQAVLPTMRAAKSGTIVNVTSVGGRLALPFNSLYHGTKFGLEGVSESTALELAPLGIRVRIVEPGGVNTDFNGRSLVLTTSDTVRDYDTLLENTLATFASFAGSGSEPIVIAKVIYKAVCDDSDQIRFPAGEDAHQMLGERYATSDENHQKKMTKQFKLEL
eukprot:IDg18065t1